MFGIACLIRPGGGAPAKITKAYEDRLLASVRLRSRSLGQPYSMQKLEDKRKSKEKRYSLALILTCVLLAKMAGEPTLQAITDWVSYRSTWLQFELSKR